MIPSTIPISELESLRIQRVIAELARRRCESINLYRPLPVQEEFHKCEAKERLIYGSNRSGKSVAAATEVARAVTGADPYGKYPKTDGICICVGKDGRHIGQIMWPKLQRAGAFKMIRDRSGDWRSFKPWDIEDTRRFKEAKKAPPLLPGRVIESIAWENKKENQPSIVNLKSGWQMIWCSSMGKPIQGVEADLIWLDEEIIECLAGWSEIYDPAVGRMRRIDEINGPFHVLSFNQETGRVEARPASKPFVKGFGEIVKATLSNGCVLFGTRHHKVLEIGGSWISLQDAFFRQSPLRPCSEGLSFWGAKELPRVSEMAARAHETCLGQHQKKHRTPCQSEETHVSRRDAGFLRREALEMQRFQAFWTAKNTGRGHAMRQAGLLAESQGPQTFSRGRVPGTSIATAQEACPRFALQAIQGACGWRYGLHGSAAQDSQASCSAGCDPCGEHARRGEASCLCVAPLPNDAQEFYRISKRPDGPASRGQRSQDRLSFAASEQDQASCSPVFVESIERVGDFPIWDITVPGTKNYVNAGISNHNSSWYDEMYARTLDRRGKLIWSATPQSATEQLYDLHERARDADSGIKEFFADIMENPHVPPDEVEAWRKQLGNKEEIARVRIGGEWAIEGYKVFPEFSERIHICKLPEDGIPHHWTRYAAVDPGVHVCAVLFLAVPPPTEGDYVVAYDELYIRQCNAVLFAKALAPKSSNQEFELFLIDPRSARVREVGAGTTIGEQYSRALADEKVVSVKTGSNFLWGTDDLQGSIEAVRGWLRVREDGTPYLRVTPNCVNFISEMKGWHYIKRQGQLTETPMKKRDHLCDCIRYLAAYDPQYVKVKGKKRKSSALQAFEAKRARRKLRDGDEDSHVQLGPAASVVGG